MNMDLTCLEAWMQAEIAPKAQTIDAKSDVLFEAFQKLGDRNLLGLRIPIEQGGQGWEEAQFSRFQILIASYSGALAFLATQHQSAARMIAASPNPALSKVLPDLISGQQGIGLGFSQLRRAGSPMMEAQAYPQGFRLSGVVPWVTGYGCFEQFIGGASLPDGQIVMGLIPFKQIQGESLHITAPMQLAAMGSTQTVEVRLNNWLLPHDHVVALHPAEWITQKDQSNTLHHGFYALGSAKGALRLLRHYARRYPVDPEIEAAIAHLQQQYCQAEDQILKLIPLRLTNPDQCLQTKARMIALAGRCAQAAIAIFGGAANLADHPAQRIYREVLAFTVFGQTSAAKRATLSALSFYEPWEKSLQVPTLSEVN